MLTVAEAAELLVTSERQIYRWVDEGEIPFQRILEQARFNRSDLLEWATSRRLPVSIQAFDAMLEADDPGPSLARAIRAGGVHHDVPAEDRDQVLRAVVTRTPMPPELDRDLVVAVLIARENSISTAIGNGIAIPHVRQPVVAAGAEATVSVSYLARPVPFGPLHGEPVRIVFFIVSPTVRAHLRLLARVARTLHDAEFRGALERCAGAQQLSEIAQRLESSLPGELAPRRIR